MIVESERPDRRDRGRRWLRWSLAAAVVLVTAGAVVLVRVVGGGPDEPRTLAEQLADQVVVVLEQATPDEHAAHGHYVEEGSQGYLCVADAFGFDPPGAVELAEVRVVYADHACAELGTRFEWPEVVRSTGPLAVELTTDPATVLLPSRALPDDPSALFTDRVRATIPADHHEAALAHDGLTNPELFHELEKRYAAASG